MSNIDFKERHAFHFSSRLSKEEKKKRRLYRIERGDGEVSDLQSIFGYVGRKGKLFALDSTIVGRFSMLDYFDYLSLHLGPNA